MSHNKFHLPSFYFLSVPFISGKEVTPAGLVARCVSSLCEDCTSVTCIELGVPLLVFFVCVCTNYELKLNFYTNRAVIMIV